jgi:hypothetical protein
MPYSAQAGQIGLRTQSAQGTYADPGVVAPNNGLFMKVRSGGLDTNRDLLVPDPEIGGTRDLVDAYLGAASWSGDYEFYARPNIVLLMLANAFGIKAAPVTTTGITTHTITPSDGAALPFMSIEERIGSGLETYRYTDAVINTLHLEADANGFVQGTAGFVAMLQQAGQTATVAPIWDTTPICVGAACTLTYNAVTVSAKSFSMDFTNNFEDDDFRVGSLFLGGLVPKHRELSFGVTLRPNDSNLWRQAVYGSVAATQPTSGVTLKQALVVTISTWETIPSGTPVTQYNIQFTIPKGVVVPFSFAPSGDDIVQNDVTIRAMRPSNATPLVTAVGKTDLLVIP